jgi:UPF0716 protein FxsA
VLALLILLVPILDIALLVRMGEAFGTDVALVFAAGGFLVGMAVLRRTGFALLAAWRRAMTARKPADEALGALLWIGAGLLFMLPGPMSDLLALALLLPPVRRRAAGWLRSRAEVSSSSHVVIRFGSVRDAQPPRDLDPDPRVIDADWYPSGDQPKNSVQIREDENRRRLEGPDDK